MHSHIEIAVWWAAQRSSCTRVVQVMMAAQDADVQLGIQTEDGMITESAGMQVVIMSCIQG
eukprot:SAG31_NODE_1875_length_7019_cov_39.090896_3_plen_61_part_00